MSCDVGKATEGLDLRHSSFSNPSVASPKSQFILQPFFRFSYVTSPSLNSPGEPPMQDLLFHKRIFKFLKYFLNTVLKITCKEVQIIQSDPLNCESNGNILIYSIFCEKNHKFSNDTS